MVTKALSPTMTECLRKLQQAGELKRLPGGFWVKPETKFDQTGKPDGSWWGTTTIEALVARGVAEYSDWKENRRGKFPVSVRFSATDLSGKDSAQCNSAPNSNIGDVTIHGYVTVEESER